LIYRLNILHHYGNEYPIKRRVTFLAKIEIIFPSCIAMTFVQMSVILSFLNTTIKCHSANMKNAREQMKPKSAGHYSLSPRFRISCGKKIAFGPGKADLLRLVAETGSIGKAAKRMDMSYMRAWSLIQTMNACFKEPVIIAARGGHDRGGARATPTGQRLLKLYQQMEKDVLRAVQKDWRAFQKLLLA